MPPKKTMQFKAESKRTVSIKEIRGLRFKAYPPDQDDGIIEVANVSDQGRVCVLFVEDFRSVEDAKVYANLLALAPLLLDTYIHDHSKFQLTVQRFEKILARVQRAKRMRMRRPMEPIKRTTFSKGE